MKIKLLFICTLLFVSLNAYCNCEGIIESIGSCKEYSCRQCAGNESFIEHKILGLNSENLCVYIEKQDNYEMICHHSEYGMMIEKRYFESILKEEIDDFIDIAKLRAKECFFINNNKPSSTNRDDVIKEAIENDFGVLSKYHDIKSIFFDEEPVNKMIDEMEKFNLRSSSAIQEKVTDNFNSRIVSLDSILYLSPDTWRVWVNGKLFINTKDLKVHSVTENYVTFIWNVDKKATKKQVSDPQNVYFGHGNVMFTLYPKQKFDLDSLS
ncbi:hypothetical protein [Wolbachia endosymbiont (group E) of Neria commutata]|uniref:hypothetical protein n=1 Tax=Wolbachia endosymbiont (group E) of Neria commutata TaxID=3066149 RepID=UPI00313299A3